MSEAMWLTALRRLLAAESGSTARFAQLATLTSEGRPSVRTVVVRAVLDDGGIQMTTDSRSAKVAGLRRCGWGELCWYFYESREQLRITGDVRIIDGDDARRAQQWVALSDATRASFYGAVPGNAVGNPGVGVAKADGPPSSFAILLLQPHEVDHLKLKSSERKLWRVGQDGEWSDQAVYP